MAVWPAVMMVDPLLPVSEEPTASVMMMWGRQAKNWSFTGAEKMAADETTARSDDRS